MHFFVARLLLVSIAISTEMSESYARWFITHKLESLALAYIFAADSIGLLILIKIFVVGSEKNVFWNRLRSRSSKVVDFGTNGKGVCDFLLVINSNLGPVLHRFWDLLAEKRQFSLPHFHLTTLRISGWALRRQDYRVLGLSVGAYFVILASVLWTQCQRPACDGRTDMPTMASTRLCITSYAEAL